MFNGPAEARCFSKDSSRSCRGGSEPWSDFAIHRPNTDQLWAVCDRGACSMLHACTIEQYAVKKEKWDSRDWKQQIEMARPGSVSCSQRHLLPHVTRADLGHPSLPRRSEQFTWFRVKKHDASAYQGWPSRSVVGFSRGCPVHARPRLLPPESRSPGQVSRAEALRLHRLVRGLHVSTYLAPRGTLNWRIRRMHEEYGPVVRINPHELHVRDNDFFDTLYAGGRPRRDRYPTRSAGAVIQGPTHSCGLGRDS